MRIISYLFVAAILFLSGCSAQLKSNIQPGIDLTSINSFYVVHFNDERHGIDKMISDELNNMGFRATYGEEENIPKDVDAIVTYVDNWQWDLTNYMIKLSITMRDSDDSMIGIGESFRTSLVRKSPPEMVKEVLYDMFNYSPPGVTE
ncbi:hypothetical protein [Desulforhopalus singaporensis]|uniref:DUF4136 domain-containing protein n=1 Tax=Desulforhopalus singaporensis TaxID=91360 RepID=A0A1H0T3X9_9BACT|nr:hypothetical protein [Desulforhopalus singaporensis]SDP48521.1 hypothetical protein SAMN05660330_02908 [Desulforhopalus singaporensis]